MKKKMIIVIVPLLIGAVVAYTMLAPKGESPTMKVEGDVYVLPRDFLINLRGDRYAKVAVALILEHGAAMETSGEGEAAAEPPEGYGPLPQEALVRTIVTEALTGQPAARLTGERSRAALKRRIMDQLEQRTDVQAEGVLFPDVTVQ